MGESLTEQRRVSEEGLRIVKLCCRGRKSRRGNASTKTVPDEEATANYVPAAAIGGALALSGCGAGGSKAAGAMADGAWVGFHVRRAR